MEDSNQNGPAEFYKILAIISLTAVFILAISIFSLIANIESNEKLIDKEIIKIENKITIKHVKKITDKELFDYIVKLNIKFPKVVLAQAKLETGNYKSNVFITKKNLFGMKLARSRPTTGQGDGKGYAHYKTWKESVIDYALLQTSYYRNCRTEQEYMEQLQRTYCENSMYIQHLRELMK